MSSQWIDSVIERHRSLTQAVVSILQSVLLMHEVEFISVTGRTKARESALEKIRRKGYKSPASELTDLSGIRVIAFSESDVKKAAKLIEGTFKVDQENSLDQDSLLATDQLGYRSVHYVCELGSDREALPEFTSLAGLKFEFQLRTVLQHAWAELSHDRSYKFAGKLPREIERKMFLFAGMLEIADKGFDDLAREIEKYTKQVQSQSDQGTLQAEVDSISLPLFVETWAKRNDVELTPMRDNANFADLVSELRDYGIRNISELQAIEPAGYSEMLIGQAWDTNIYGVVRDWMLVHDWRRYAERVKRNWVLALDEAVFLRKLIPEDEIGQFISTFSRTS
jgi:putative GTP pyrophosphokinase